MSEIKDVYLIAYNGACCGGWAVVLGAVVSFVVSTAASGREGLLQASANVYSQAEPSVDWWLTLSQTAALLEIVHAALKLVRSPIMVTFMQVSSRIVALVAIVYSTEAQNQWGAGLMMASWAAVEVPRYAFYLAALITGDATKKTPFPLFWLRYSLFALLYPTGIVGELTVFLAAANDDQFVQRFTPAAAIFYGTLLPIVYFFGSPFMVLNMVTNRKSAFKKRFAKPPPPPRGLCWPLDDKGERSSTKVNQAIVAAAMAANNPTKAQDMLNSKSSWRFAYWKHLKALVQEQCASPQAALAIAQAGLDKAYELFEFVAPDGSAITFQHAMTTKDKTLKNKNAGGVQFFTHKVEGTATSRVEQVQVPYKGRTLSGTALKEQVQAWVDYGTIEPSAGEAICQCVDHPEWIGRKALQERYFVLLGAGSAMGPLLVLLSIGANVIAIDLDRAPIWERLIGLARNSMGTLTFPVQKDPSTFKTDEDLFRAAGCNLFTHTPLIRDWLLDLYPDKAMTVGSYAYLNGALHVQVSLAMDAICRDLSQQRDNVSLAYLCTPTDLHLIPQEAHQAQLSNYQDYKNRLYCIILSLLSNGKFLRKNAQTPIASATSKDGGSGSDDEFYLVNGISVAQGPNYALAKRMQHWRAIVARFNNNNNNKGKQNCVVSSNIAPSTSTASVVQNQTFAWAYEGMPYFVPYEIFAPETSNAVMSALLFYDLNHADSVANPRNKNSTIVKNPNQLFSYGSFHGGVWRCAYTIDSIGEASVFLYFGRVAQPYLLTGAGVVGAVAAAFYFGG